MKTAAKHSVTVITCTAISEKNMASITDTTKPHGKMLLVAITFVLLEQSPRFFAVYKILSRATKFWKMQLNSLNQWHAEMLEFALRF